MSDPIGRLVELAVYAPIGMAAVARDRLPELVDEGRTRVEQRLTLARFIGQMVVTQGRRELERRARESAGAADPEPAVPTSRPTSTPRPTPHSTPDTSGGPSDPEGDADTAPAVTADPVPEPPTVAADSLPIEGYESLAAAQVVARLADLDDDALSRIEQFERDHRNRRTVLNRIAQLRAR